MYWPFLDSHFMLFGILVYLIQIVSYTYTFLKNPGIPKNKNSSGDSDSRDIELNNSLNETNKSTNKRNKHGYQFCNKCHIFVDIEKNVTHCEDCNVCIEGIFLLLFF